MNRIGHPVGNNGRQEGPRKAGGKDDQEGLGQRDKEVKVQDDNKGTERYKRTMRDKETRV